MIVVAVPIVELFFHLAGGIAEALFRSTDGSVVLADVAYIVAGFSEEHGIGAGESIEGKAALGAESNTMHSFVLAGKDASAVRRAGGRRCECVAESDTVACETVDVRGLDDWVACTAEVVAALVVGENYNDVWRQA